MKPFVKLARSSGMLYQGQMRLGDLITHRLPLARWQEGIYAGENNSALKALLKS